MVGLRKEGKSLKQRVEQIEEAEAWIVRELKAEQENVVYNREKPSYAYYLAILKVRKMIDVYQHQTLLRGIDLYLEKYK